MSQLGPEADIPTFPNDVRFTPQQRTWQRVGSMSEKCQQATSPVWFEMKEATN
jgi:hypothetical protein